MPEDGTSRRARTGEMTVGGVTRRLFIGRSAGVALSLGGTSAFLAACGGGSSGSQVNVLTFESYIDPNIMKMWAHDYPHITLNGTPGSDDDEILTKLRAGGASAYDVVGPDFGYAPIYYREGLVEPLNLESQPAASQLYSVFREDVAALPYLLAPNKAIAFPCEWAPTAMTYNTTLKFQPSSPPSWTDLWEKEIPRGNVGFEGLPPEGNIATAALALGFPLDRVFKLDQAELNRVVSYFREIKPFRTYSADPEMRDAIRTGTVWAGVTPTPGFASEINGQVGKTIAASVVPKEGSVGFIDGMALVKNAKNRENALTWINWFAGNAKVRDYVFQAYRAAPCSEATVKRLLGQGGSTADLVRILKGPEPEIATKVIQGQPPANPKAYTAAWDQILA